MAIRGGSTMKDIHLLGFTFSILWISGSAECLAK